MTVPGLNPNIQAQGGIRKSSVLRAGLFIVPAIIVTSVSIILFTRLSGLPSNEFNAFSITILAAVLLSLLAAAPMQIQVNKIIEDRVHFNDGAAARSVRLGLVYCLISTLVVSALVYPYLVQTLGFTTQGFLYFFALNYFFSGTWIMTSAFFATDHYIYPSLIYTIAYLFVFFLTLGAFALSHEYAILGYTGGIAILFLLLLLGSVKAFPWPQTSTTIIGDISKLPRFDAPIRWATSFNILYVLTIFLDKLIVWVYQGRIADVGLIVTGSYTSGSFLGLIPLFSIGSIAYFNSMTKTLVDSRYEGTRKRLKAQAREYKRIYRRLFFVTLLIALGLLIITIVATNLFLTDVETIKILVTIGLGTIFLSGIIFNSVVLPLFGRSEYSTLAVLIVMISELATIPFVTEDIWYAALGFCIGCFLGCLLSTISTIRYVAHFESNIFRLVSLDTLNNFNQKRSSLT
jgi:hypothetical protein